MRKKRRRRKSRKRKRSLTLFNLTYDPMSFPSRTSLMSQVLMV